MKKLRMGFAVFALAVSTQAAWMLVDNFDGYDNSAVTTIGNNGGGDASIGVWDGVFDGTGNAQIYDNIVNANDNVLEVWGIPGQGGTGWRGASTDLASNFGTDFTLPDNSTSTLFFQFKAGDTDNFDCMFGLTDTQSTLDNTDSWQDFAVMPFLSGGGAGVADLKVSEGVVIENVDSNTWYNVWLVVDTASNTFDVYSSTGTDDGSPGVSGSAFRNGKGLAALQAFGLAEREAGHVRIDNIYFAPGEDTTHPLAAVILDDFSGDLSAYTGTRILDSDGGTHNTVAWQIASEALELNTTTKISVAEQYAFIRAGLGLGVNEEIQADFSITGSQDMGLYVGGTTPVTDVRQDYVAVYARSDGNVYSRGFDGTTEYALAGAGVVTYDKLFIKRTETNTYEAGYYNGDVRTVVVTRTPLTPNGGDVVGFYADVRAAGILSSADNLVLLPSNDTDGDGIPDDWEQQIVDDNPGDGITSIDDVLPADDYDDDDFTNGQEYEMGTDPTVANSADTDTDGDYLPDLWEFSTLSNLTYNSYDDPDSDDYNNQAERIGGTDPLLDTDHPDFMAPTVGFIRDSIVTNNACLMAGGNYGHAINGVSHQDQILYTFLGYQYTAYYDTVGSVQKIVLARRTVDDTSVGPWETFQTDSEFINGDETGSNGGAVWDSHNVIDIGICPEDGTLHIAWDHHGSPLRYRRSLPGLCTTNKDTVEWGGLALLPEQNWLVAPGQTETVVTYPQFTTTPSGGLVLNRRYITSGNGDQYLHVYNPATTNWLERNWFIDKAGTFRGPDAFGNTVTANERCAYLNGLDFDTNGTMHITWTWREAAAQYGNRDICYAYSPDMGTNWYNNIGSNIADTSIGEKITMNSPGITVVPLNMRQLLINQQAQCVDQDGRVHAMMLHRRQEAGYGPEVFSAKFSNRLTAFYHYFRDPDTGVWTQRRIPPPDGDYEIGSRPCMGYDSQGNVYAAFLYWPVGKFDIPGARLDNTFTGTLVIASASKASHYTDWEVLQIIDEYDFDGEPLLDQPRLLSDNILAVYIQEHDVYTGSAGIPTPLHVYEFAVDIPEPASSASISYTFMGDDVVVSAFGQANANYQMQSIMDLTETNGWNNVGLSVNGMSSLIAFPDADGLLHNRMYYKVIHSLVP